MARFAVLYVPGIGRDTAQWAVSDDEGNLLTDIEEGSFAEAGIDLEGLRIILVIPADDVLLASAVVPGNSLARVQQAIPFALEDQVADDVDSLHFALGAKSADDEYPVAVISHSAMERVMEQCQAADIRPAEVVPETLALPELMAATADMTVWTGFLDKGRAVIRLTDMAGFATDLPMASMMIEGAAAQLPEDGVASLVVFRTTENDRISVPDAIDLEVRPCEHPLAVYATGLATAPRINLLQGSYNPKTDFDKAWKPWRTSMALAACVCLALLAGKWFDVRQLQKQEAELDSQIAAAFQQALPNTRMQRPRRQIQSALDSMGAGNSDGFTQRLSQIATSLSTQPQTQLRTIGYRRGRFDLDLNTDAVPTLDALGAEISKRGSMAMSVQSANRENNLVRGRIRIE